MTSTPPFLADPAVHAAANFVAGGTIAAWVGTKIYMVSQFAKKNAKSKSSRAVPKPVRLRSSNAPKPVRIRGN